MCNTRPLSIITRQAFGVSHKWSLARQAALDSLDVNGKGLGPLFRRETMAVDGTYETGVKSPMGGQKATLTGKADGAT